MNYRISVFFRVPVLMQESITVAVAFVRNNVCKCIISDKWNSHCDWSLHLYTKNRHFRDLANAPRRVRRIKISRDVPSLKVVRPLDAPKLVNYPRTQLSNLYSEAIWPVGELMLHRSQDDLLYIYAAYITVPHFTFLVYIVEFTRNSENWSNELGQCLNDEMDERYLCNMLRKNAENDPILWSTLLFLQLVQVITNTYLWNPIQFEIFIFNKWTENSILACSTLSRTGSIKFCKVELHGFVLVAFLMTSWQIRYHVVLASFSLWLMQTLFSYHAYGLFRSHTGIHLAYILTSNENATPKCT